MCLVLGAAVSQAAPLKDADYLKVLGHQLGSAAATQAAIGITEVAVKSDKARRPASALDESQMSPELRALRDKWLKVSQPGQIDALLEEYNKNYTSLPLDVKYTLAQVDTLRPFRGILWRITPLVNGSTSAHSLLLTLGRSVISSVHVFRPEPHWQVLTDYLAQPFARGDAEIAQIHNEAEFQNYLSKEVFPILAESQSRLDNLKLDKPMVWDNQFIVGAKQFTNPADRFVSIGEVERLSSVATLASSLAQIYVINSYSLNHSIEILNRTQFMYGFDGIFSGKVHGATLAQRLKIVRDPRYSSYLTLLPWGPDYMAKAFAYTRHSVSRSVAAWDLAKQRPASESDLINTGWIVGSTYSNDLRAQTAKAVIHGPTAIHSLTGEVVTVDLPAFYKNPPKDLKAFLPTRTDDSKSTKTVELTFSSGKKKVVSYRNFEEGRALGWDLAVFQPYFPELKGEDAIPRAARILSESYGSYLVLNPLSSVL